MFSTFDLCLLLYVIRLAGWLKHCNLSLSLSLSAGRPVGGPAEGSAGKPVGGCAEGSAADEAAGASLLDGCAEDLQRLPVL